MVVAAGGTVVVSGAVVVVVGMAFNPCLGTVVTVTPSAMMNCPVRTSRSPMVETPVTSSFHKPGARSKYFASASMSAPPGLVMGTLMV